MPAEPAVQATGSARHRYSRLMDDAGLHILEQVTERARRGHPVEDGVVRLPATCRGCGSDQRTPGSPRYCGECAHRARTAR